MQHYEHKCVHCSSTNVFACTNDGGSVQQCNDCHQSYKAKKIEALDAINMVRPGVADRKRGQFLKRNNDVQ